MSATAVPVAPGRSVEQRMEALRKANRIRLARAVLKRDIKRGRCLASDVLIAPPEYADTMKVLEFLLAAPKVGRVKAAKWLRVTNTSSFKTLGGLSQRQREELVALLGERR